MSVALAASPHWAIPALCERWGCSKVTTYSILKEHSATVLKLGRLTRIPHAEVERIELASAGGFSEAPMKGKRKANVDHDAEALA